MRTEWFKSALVCALLAGAPALAQEQGSDTQTAEPQVGQTYLAETFADWQMRCTKREPEPDQCHIFQQLQNNDGGNVIRVSLFAVPGDQRVAAGAHIVAPLETLLTANLRMVIDDSHFLEYPFSFCTVDGCLSRAAFTQEDVDKMKAGANAVLSIVPAAFPDASVEPVMSLSGFTAGFNALLERLPEQ